MQKIWTLETTFIVVGDCLTVIVLIKCPWMGSVSGRYLMDCVVEFDLSMSSGLMSTEGALNCTLAGCQDNCAVTRTGSMCYCKSGYEIGQDGKTCTGQLRMHNFTLTRVQTYFLNAMSNPALCL